MRGGRFMTSQEHQALEKAFAHALAHLDGLGASPVAAQASLGALRRQLQLPLPRHGMDAAQVVDELAAGVKGGILGSQGGRFFGWVIGGGLPAAIAADWLTSVWDQNAGIFACGPAASVVEEVAGEWLRELFELPQ